jgi:hypothetical protein
VTNVASDRDLVCSRLLVGSAAPNGAGIDNGWLGSGQSEPGDLGALHRPDAFAL